jgi:predicted transport protein
MSLYKITKNNLVFIPEKKIDLEKDLQKLTEQNLAIIFGLKFISSEFPLKGFRMDTLGFDEENKAFVIIEYKRDKSFSIIDQGFSYLSLMLENKAELLLEYNEKTGNNLKKKDIDWSQSQVLFLANSFTSYQENAINFRDLPIELWEVKKYENDIILFNQLKPDAPRNSIKAISKNKVVEKISREIKVYSIDDHFKPGWEMSRAMLEETKERILAIDSRIEEKIHKFYIGYNIGVFRVCEITAYKSKIEIGLHRVNKKDLKDPENKLIKVPWEKWGWGKQCGYSIKSSDDIPYALFLVKQVYNKFYK